MMKLAALLLLLVTSTASTSAAKNGNGNNGKNGHEKKFGFTAFDEAGSSSSTATTSSTEEVEVVVAGGECTLRSSPDETKTCSNGVVQSFTLTNLYGSALNYVCTCPAACAADANVNAGVGSYICTTSDHENTVIDGFCGDVDIPSLIFSGGASSSTCQMDIADGTIRCEGNCYCDASAWICTKEGEECCGGLCQKPRKGPGVKGWEIYCLPIPKEEEAVVDTTATKKKKNVGVGNTNQWEQEE